MENKKIEKLKTYYHRRKELFGATDGEETDLRNETLDDACDKINELVEAINKLQKN